MPTIPLPSPTMGAYHTTHTPSHTALPTQAQGTRQGVKCDEDCDSVLEFVLNSKVFVDSIRKIKKTQTQQYQDNLSSSLSSIVNFVEPQGGAGHGC